MNIGRPAPKPPAPTKCVNPKCGLVAAETICHLCGTPRVPEHFPTLRQVAA